MVGQSTAGKTWSSIECKSSTNREVMGTTEHEECGQGDEFSDGMDWADDLLDCDNRNDDDYD